MDKSILKKKPLLWFGLIIIFLVIYFLGRQIALYEAGEILSNKLSEKYQLHLSTDGTEFKGIKSLLIQKTLVTDINNDTVFFADSLFFQLRLWPLLSGKIRLGKFTATQFYINANGNLLDKFIHYHKHSADSTLATKSENPAKRIENVFNTIFSIVPQLIDIKNISLVFHRGKLKSSSTSSRILLDNGQFESTFNLTDDGFKSQFAIAGSVDRINQTFTCKVATLTNGPVVLPYINQKWEASVKFDSLRFDFKNNGNEWGKIKFNGYAEVANLIIQHKKISPLPVVTKLGKINFNFTAGEKFLELDSSSVITLNKFSFNPYLRYQHYDDKEIFIKLPKFRFEADSMFESLPIGLFTSLRGIKVKGGLSYSLDFYLNLNKPDSIRLSSELVSQNFSIISFGAANLNMLNDTFVYTAYDHDVPVAKIFVGLENKNFVSLENISSFLKYSVLSAEDGDFFFHHGFNEEAFKNSISENIKEHRFARGGSTITMQLVKNVFLTRNKTISRKLEEMLIVWMIENMHLVSKERMFEVYLNVIEWGPGVYGIKQAAKFYFKKKPNELSLGESIFLASIIPSPKYFPYAFKEPGILTNYYAWFYSRLPEVMIRRNQILPEDTIGLKPEIKLKGAAKKYMANRDTSILNKFSGNNYTEEDNFIESLEESNE